MPSSNEYAAVTFTLLACTLNLFSASDSETAPRHQMSPYTTSQDLQSKLDSINVAAGFKKAKLRGKMRLEEADWWAAHPSLNWLIGPRSRLISTCSTALGFASALSVLTSHRKDTDSNFNITGCDTQIMLTSVGTCCLCCAHCCLSYKAETAVNNKITKKGRAAIAEIEIQRLCDRAQACAQPSKTKHARSKSD